MPLHLCSKISSRIGLDAWPAWMLLVLLFVALQSATASAASYYVAAQGASNTGQADGSKDRPFPNLTAALRSGRIEGGDSVLFTKGDHGVINLHNTRFETPVIFKSESERDAHLDGIRITGRSGKLTFQNFDVWPENPTNESGPLVVSSPASADITVEGLTVGGGRDAAEFLSWPLQKWRQRKINGIQLKGARSIVRFNTVTGIRFGIITSGPDSLVERNWVNGFSGDGLRGTGDRNTFRGNRVTNCIKIDNNHDDGFQSWSPRKQPNAAITGGVVEGNTFIEWTEVKGHPLQCRLQGIGMFDGFFDNWLIQNNIISISAYHGITVSGGRGVTIINNTVVAHNGQAQNNPWISTSRHKNGTPPSNILVANNLAMRIKGASNPARKIHFAGNSLIKSPIGAFENPAGFNYRPVARSGFLDSAISEFAPATDIFGVQRPVGSGPDRGAIEVGGS